MSGLVSILIPVYNRREMVATAVDSALRQTYPDIEVVIGDNRSTDGTFEYLREKYGQDGRVRLFQNPRNVGPVQNWINCADVARGSIAKILFSDDWIEDSYLDQTVPYLSDGRVGFAFSPTWIVFPDKRRRILDSLPRSGTYKSERFLEDYLFFWDMPASPGCAIFRTTDVRHCLGTRIPSRTGLDFARYGAGVDIMLFLITLSQYPRFACALGTSAFFRVHAGSLSMSNDLYVYYDVARRSFCENLRPSYLREFDYSRRAVRVTNPVYAKEFAASTEIGFVLRVSFLLKKIGRRARYTMRRLWTDVWHALAGRGLGRFG
jgi:glycosyltransferase involved in cell wall biosynthesis